MGVLRGKVLGTLQGGPGRAVNEHHAHILLCPKRPPLSHDVFVVGCMIKMFDFRVQMVCEEGRPLFFIYSVYILLILMIPDAPSPLPKAGDRIARIT